MLTLAVVAFSIAWWLGLYLLARDGGRAAMRRAGLGLLAFAVAVALMPFDGTVVERAAQVIAGLPALIWPGVLIALLPVELEWRAAIERGWRFLVVPLGVGGLVVAAIVGGWWRPAIAAVVVVPLLAVLVVLLRTRRRTDTAAQLVVVATLFFGLGVALLVAPLDWLPDAVVLGAIGIDLALLGVVVAASSAFEAGEALAADLRRSAVAAALVAVVFGAQLGLVTLGGGDTDVLAPLAFGVVGTGIAVVTLGGVFQATLDRVVFAAAPQLRAERSELREAGEALPRRDAHRHLADLDDEAFTRLVREALRHYGDLGKLVSSPLTSLPAIDRRLAGRDRPDQSLERAAELKAVLLESIERLKPRDQQSGTSEEWRFYNALYFPYVRGIRPYRRQPDLSGLDDTTRRVFDWFRRYVPERTLYNWQNQAAKVVAIDVRARNWQ